MNFLKISRSNVWWKAVIPQVLGWVYFCLLIGDSTINGQGFKIGFFFIALISISSFGYLFNDYWDQEGDGISGKINLLNNKKVVTKGLFILAPLCMGIVAWFFVDAGLVANGLFILQLVALYIYSAPPFRFKSRSVLGVITDAFYGHLNPILITLSAFGFPDASKSIDLIVICVIFICASLKGIRNILLHQLEDRKKDFQSNIKTFAVRKGAMYTLDLINKVLPIEIALTFMLVVFISMRLPPFFLSILFFSCLVYFTFSGWKLPYLPKRQLKFKFLFFLNDYYEEWIPVSFLILLSVRQPEIIWLLILHLILFPSFVRKLWNTPKVIMENLKTGEDY